MPDYTSDPLPEREENQLLLTVKDIMHNGGRMPQDVSNELLMAAIIELNTCVTRNANLSRKNALAIRNVGLAVASIALIILGLHSGIGSGLISILVALAGA